QGIARGEKMDLILQKATELGVSRIIPVTSLRSNVRLTAETAQAKREHWQGVVASACGQCGRNRVPEVAEPRAAAEAVQSVGSGLKLVLVADAEARDLRSLLAGGGAHGARLPVALLIGSEGGLAPEDLRVARLADFTPCSLGSLTLRTDTAALDT